MTEPSQKLLELLRFLTGLLYGVVRNNPSRLAGRIRRWSLRTPCQIDTAVLITRPARFQGRPGSALRHGCHIGNDHGRVSLGAGSHLGAYCHVNAVHGEVRIGDDVAIGPGVMIISYSNAYVPGQAIADSKHTADVVIGDHVFIGANVTVLPGSIIESRVVVGAGAVVKGTLESGGVYVGAPCRRVRELPNEGGR